MGRHLERKVSDVGFEDHHPGCMWGILHILNYHYWQSSKRLPLRRKHGRGKYAVCCGNPKTFSFDHYADEVQEYLNAEAAPLLAEQETTVTSPTNRITRKGQIKDLIAKEMFAKSNFQKTDWANPIIIVHKSAEDSSKQNQLPPTENEFSLPEQTIAHTRRLDREISCPQFKESMDVMEIFKVNKKFFLEVLQDPEVRNTHVQQTSNAKVKLMRSGSFPVVDSSHNRFSRPATIEHKQKEIWSFPKEEKTLSGAQALSSTASKSLEDSYKKSIASTAQETRLSSINLAHGLNKQKWHLPFTSHFKGLKKKIKHALKESKNESNHVSRNALLYSVPSGGKFSKDEKEMPEKFKEINVHEDGIEDPRSSSESNGYDNDLSEGQFPSMGRASSLKESVDSYSRLFDHSLSREGKRHQYQSKSLKLSNEDRFQSIGLKSFRRRLSMPDIETIYQIANESSGDAFGSKTSSSTVTSAETNAETRIHENRKQFKPQDVVEETEIQRNIMESVDSMKNIECSGVMTSGIHTEMQELNPHTNPEIGSAITSIIEHEEKCPDSVLETHFQDDMTQLTEVPTSEGSVLEPWSICGDEQDYPVSIQDRSCKDSSEEPCSTANAENANAMVGVEFHHFELNGVDDADFNYVRDVLELSGFIGQDFFGTWYSLEQPLSPTLFKALEAYLHKERESYSEDVAYNCDHLLIFGLINEVLLEIYGSSLAYFPKSFSFTQGVRPLPKGNRVLEEVWKRISWYKMSSSEMEQSLEDIVALDWAKGDGWMNLQLDVEDVTLDLEDLIFDELLNEVICA